MQKELKIILTLISKGFQSGVRGANNIFKNFTNGITNGAVTASRALVDIARGVFFLREAFSTLFNIARKLWDLLVGGAQSLAKIEAQFIALTGSAEAAEEVMAFAADRALALGKSTEDVAAGLALMASGAKDASGAFDMSKLQELNVTLEQMATLRPDLPVERIARAYNAFLATGDISQLEMILDMPLKSAKAMQGIASDMGDASKTISQGVYEIETGAAQAAGDADTRLKALQETIKEIAPGIEEGMEAMSDVSGLERLAAAGQDMADAFGGPVFEAVNELASGLADIYEQDPEMFREVARSLGEGVAEIIRSLGEIDTEKLAEDLGGLSEKLAGMDWQDMASQIGNIAESFADIASSLEDISQAIETWKQIQEIGKLAEEEPEAFAAAIGKPGMGGAARTARDISQYIEESDILQGLIRQGPSGMAAAAAQRIIVEIDLKNDMLDAQIKQGADAAVTDGLNAVADEFSEGAR